MRPGFEINSSTFLNGDDMPMPSADILSLCRGLGGTILTFGLGRERPGQLGTYIKVAQGCARSLGFSSFYTFEDLEPHFHIL